MNSCWHRRVAVVGVVLLLAGCGVPARQARLGNRSPTAVAGVRDTVAQPSLQVAAAPLISPQATITTYDDLFAYIGARFGRPTEVLQRRTYAEINDLVRAGTVDLALVCSFAYVLGKEEFGMELVAMPSVGGKAEYYSYIIVRADSGLTEFADLEGKSFAFTDPLSTSGRLAAEGMVKDRGATPETYFSRVIFTFSHDNSIRSVLDRLVDGAAIDSLVLDSVIHRDPATGAALRIVGRAGPFGSPPFVVNPRLPEADKRRLQSILLNMHLDADGQRILAALNIDRFVAPDDAAFDPVRRLAEHVRPRP